MNKIFTILFCLLIIVGMSIKLFANKKSSGHEKKKIVALVGQRQGIRFIKAARDLREIPEFDSKVEVRVFFINGIQASGESREFLKSADIILYDGMYRGFQQLVIESNKDCHAVCYELRGRNTNAIPNRRKNKDVMEYHSLPGKENIKNLLLYLAARECNSKVKYAPPIKIPEIGIFHPEASDIFTSFKKYKEWLVKSGRYKQNAPWVGVNEFKSMVTPQDIDPVAADIIKRIEKANLNVLPVYGLPHDKAMERYFLDEMGKSQVNAIVPLSFGVGGSTPGMRKIFDKLACPVFNSIRMFDYIETWGKSQKGLTPRDLLRHVSMTERNGQIEPTVIGGKVKFFDEKGWNIGADNFPLSERMTVFIKRLEAWLNLQKKHNKDKKIVIMYYSHPGKQNVGASYLNVFASLSNILKYLKAEGYNVKGEIPDEEKMKNLVIKSGINIGAYAPGELDELLENSPLIIKVKKAAYKKWFMKLPEKFKMGVEKDWGTVEKFKPMTENNSFCLPCVSFGNVILMPQPARGWSADPAKLYHSTALYPHHQYNAAYYWLREIFKADALIYLGRHGTFEWLPGKETGLSHECVPEVLGGAVPVIYPYIVDGIGEGLIAKRRGRGVILSHLTPMINKAGISQEHLQLYELINSYNRISKLSPEVAKNKLKSIVGLSGKLGFKRNIKISDLPKLTPKKIEDYLENLEETLEAIKDSNIPYGLHIYGQAPTGKEAKEFSVLIHENNPEVSLEKISANLQKTSDELASLVNALNGQYIKTTCGYDPIRDAKVLPTGRNFYGIDLDRIPSKAAYEAGKKTADEMIRNYRNANDGKYPRKVGLTLWCGEAQRTEGAMISAALWLMGMQPEWTKRGTVKGVQAIPKAILNRPRIDVHMQLSGLFRDTLPSIMLLLDDASRQAVLLEEAENFIRENSVKVEKELIGKGVSPKKAKLLSRQRVFSAAPGTYGTRIANLSTASGLWDKDSELGEVYINNVSFAYGRHFNGAPSAAVYRKSLSNIDIAAHSRSSNLYQTLDTDDVFQYLGGLAAAVKAESGKTPQVYISHMEKRNKEYLEDIASTIEKELAARSFNPKWIEGMMKHKYSGAREMLDHAENLWGWQTTVKSSVNNAQWRQIYEVYIQDKYKMGLENFFQKHSPWAMQSISARLLETDRKKYWKMPEEIKKDLASKYAKSVIQDGVSCCDHTCNNPFLNQMVLNIISMPGIMLPEDVEKFKLTVERALNKKLQDAVKERKELQSKLSSKIAERKEQEIAELLKEEPEKKKKIDGYEITKEEEKEESNPISSSGMIWQVILAVAAIFILLGWGISRKNS